MELNPSDNHGLRYDLSHAFLVHGRDLDALALSKRYPQDGSPPLDLNTALAQFRTGNLPAAQETLRQAKRDHPKVVTMLLKGVSDHLMCRTISRCSVHLHRAAYSAKQVPWLPKIHRPMQSPAEQLQS